MCLIKIKRFLIYFNELFVLKVVTVIGIYGTCRGDELHKILIDHIEDTSSAKLMKITLPETKTQKERFFYFDNSNYEIVKKYYNLRPTACPTRQFLLNYQNGKCTR